LRFGLWTGFYGEEVFTEFSRYQDSHFAGFSRLVRSTFDDAVNYFSDASIDLLHIDGLHTYDAVKHDFETWLPKMSAGGVILFHDTNVRENEFGVWKYWQELAATHPHFRFDHCNGLGVLGMGSELPIELKRLFNLSRKDPGTEAALVRQFFSILGTMHLQTYDARAGFLVSKAEKGGSAADAHFWPDTKWCH
jgi:O-antigen biosynthesis protein